MRFRGFVSFAVLASTMLATPLTAAAPPATHINTASPREQTRSLTLEQRVEYQRRLEEVAWRHRLWPKENPGPKPALSAVMTDAPIRAKVEHARAVSAALERFWKRPLTTGQLQSEMNRLARDTRDASRLREMFAALDNDPYVIAECLARPLLADRFARSWYASDTRFHGALKKRVEQEVASMAPDAGLKKLSGKYSEIVYRKKGAAGAAGATQRDGGILLESAEWEQMLRSMTKRHGARSLADIRLGTRPLIEETATEFNVQAVIAIDADTVRVASSRWPKSSFDRWLEDAKPSLGDAPTATNTPDSADLKRPTIAGASCLDDKWLPTRSLQPPESRMWHTAVWTGAEMIVWGGLQSTGGGGQFGWAEVNTGGRYDPSTDNWMAMSTGANTPSERHFHTAVWTGSEMIVWGGTRINDNNGSGEVLNDGSRYNPVTDTWSPTSDGLDVAQARKGHTAIWTGTEMIVWGGVGAGFGFYVCDGTEVLDTGGRYNPLTDTWTPTSVGVDVPTAACLPDVVWTGSEMIVWGGYSDGDPHEGGRYTPSTDSWVPMPGSDFASQGWAVWTGSEMFVPGGRYSPANNSWAPTNFGGLHGYETAVWTGTEVIVWGGGEVDGELPLGINTGSRFNPSTGAIQPTSVSENVPSSRLGNTAVWTGSEMVVWGGGEWVSTFDSGGRYDPSTDSWVPTTAAWHVTDPWSLTSVWTGTEAIIWETPNNVGGRYDPATDIWEATSVSESTPYAGSAVWTGAEMILWDSHDQTGGRYNPATDNWVPTSTPAFAQLGGTAVWTGSEMILWDSLAGGRYNPTTNDWLPMSASPNADNLWTDYTTVWTGTEMIVWGGRLSYGNVIKIGARYSPTTDTWLLTNTGGDVPSARLGHTAVWTGSEMIIWGGANDYNVVTESGARYDPTKDTWQPTSTGANAPDPRSFHSAVWTGSEMIVWGGEIVWTASFLNTGGRYDSMTDSWAGSSLTTGSGENVPIARSGHLALWTGQVMIVWGGSAGDTGGRYSVCYDKPPVANAGPDQVLECTGHRQATATLDGSRSIDPDSSPGTNDDIAQFDWSEGANALASSEIVSVPFTLGAHTVTMAVTDKAGLTDSANTHVTVQDTQPPFGSITFPAPLQCFGPAVVPVTITDNITDTCDPNITRAYTPAGGPSYAMHGDCGAALTATDSSGNASTASVFFTIDLVPPHVTLFATPPETRLPSTIPFSQIFQDDDADGASGGVMREQALWDGCVVFDGATYGNKDGLLSDESLVADQRTFCDAVERCGLQGLDTSVVTIRATDCGGNATDASRVLPIRPTLTRDACNMFLTIARRGQVTEVGWNPVIAADAYDLVRGNVASLDHSGSTVDLGPVTCLATNVPLTSVDDPETPAPGEAFFYLSRYRRGGIVSEYGWDSSGNVRSDPGNNCPK